MEWTYCIGNGTVILEHRPLRCVIAIAVITWRPLKEPLLRTRPGNAVWNRVITWADNKAVEVLELPITEAQRTLLGGDDWADAWDSDAAVVEFTKAEKKAVTGKEYS
jgi:hypothetical protein